MELHYNILEYFLDNNCKIVGPGLINILLGQFKKTTRYDIICDDNNKIKDVETFFTMSQKFGCSEKWECKESKNGKLWSCELSNHKLELKIKKKLSKYQKNTSQLELSKQGLNHSEGPIKVLKILRDHLKENNKNNNNNSGGNLENDEEYLNICINWLEYMINNNHKIYGG